MSMHAHRGPDDGEQGFLDFLEADRAASGSFRRTAKRARMALLCPERGSADRPPGGWSTLLTGFLLLAVDAVVLDAAVRLESPALSILAVLLLPLVFLPQLQAMHRARPSRHRYRRAWSGGGARGEASAPGSAAQLPNKPT